MGEFSREGAGRKGLAAATAPGADGGDDGDCGGDGDEDDDGVLPSWIHNRKCQGKAVRSCRSETAADPAKELGSTIGRSDPFTNGHGHLSDTFCETIAPLPRSHLARRPLSKRGRPPRSVYCIHLQTGITPFFGVGMRLPRTLQTARSSHTQRIPFQPHCMYSPDVVPHLSFLCRLCLCLCLCRCLSDDATV